MSRDANSVSVRIRRYVASAAMIAVVSGMPCPTAAAIAAAPGPSNVVSVCSGIRLPNSAITSIVSPLTTATAALETTTNTILGALSVLSGTPRVATNIASLMSSAGSDTTTVQAVSTDGTLIGPSGSCYSSASGFTLAAPAGLSLGGNALTGLGDAGQGTANAKELSAIAFGNAATTAVGATNAVALGSDAQVAAAGTSALAIGANAAARAGNSIALGAGSISERGAVAGYSAFGLAAPQTSVGEVSVGSAGAARQITNVAAGSSATDAVNVSQLAAVSQSVTQLGGLAVQYSSAAKGMIALGGASGTVVANVAAGSLAAGSTEAVNGAQLRATNAAVATNTDSIASLGVAVADNGTAIATTAGAVSTLRGDVANGRVGPVRFSDGATPALPNGGVPSQHVTLAGAVSGAVGLHNVAAGTVASGSTDAVNGGQLALVSGRIDAIGPRLDADEATVAAIGTRLTANEASTAAAGAGVDLLNRGGAGALRYAAAASPTTPNGGAISRDVTLVGAVAGPVGLHNVAAGTIGSGSTDAVNGGQLAATNAAVAANTGAVTVLSNGLSDTNDALATVRAAVAGTVGATAALDVRTTANTIAIGTASDALTGLRSDIVAGRLGAVRFSTAGAPSVPGGGPSQDVTLVGVATGAVGLHNLAAGVVAAGSADAVTGGQLFDTTATIAGLSGRIDANDITIAGLGARLSTNEADIATASAGVALLSRGASGPVRYADAALPTIPNGGSISQDVALVGAAPGVVGLHNVAGGRLAAGSADAVNGAQLFDTNVAVATNASAVADLGAGLATANDTLAAVRADVAENAGDLVSLSATVASNTSAIGAVSSASAGVRADVSNGRIGPVRFSAAASPNIGNGGIPSQDLALAGGVAGAVGLHNLAAGIVASGSTDAVNGGQLFETRVAVTGLSDRVDGIGARLTASEADAADLNLSVGLLTRGGIGSLRYSDASSPITPNGGTISQDVTLAGLAAGAVGLHNVAGGVIAATSTDAVNGAQLHDTNAALLVATGRIDALGASLGGDAALLASLDGRVSLARTDIDALSVSLGDANAGIALLTRGGAGPVRYSDASAPTTPLAGPTTQDLTLVGSAAGPVRLHNVADGAIADGSTDAINGGQLRAALAGIEAGGALGVAYDDPTRARITFASGAAPVLLANVAPGALSPGSTEAVNGAQLNDTNRSVDVAVGRLDVLDGRVTATASGLDLVRDDLAAFSSAVARGGTGPLRYADAASPNLPNGGVPSQDLRLVGASADAVRLHNLASGSIADGSTDAVNGAQLFATNATVAGLGDRVGVAETRLGDADAAIASANARIATNDGAIARLDGDIGLLRIGGAGPVRYADAGSPTVPNGGAPSQDLTLVGGGTGPVALHNVAAGGVSATSTDAVNGAQIYGFGETLDALAVRVGSAVMYDGVTGRVSLRSGDGSPVVVTNLADGVLAAGSTDAVNGRQLYRLQQTLDTTGDRVASVSARVDALGRTVSDDGARIAALDTRFSRLSSDVSNGALGPLRYSSAAFPITPGGATSNHVTLVGADGSAVALHNVAPGAIASGSLDAVNGGQVAALGSGIAAVLGLGYDGSANAFAGSLRFNGNDYASVQSVLGAIAADITSGPGAAGKYFHANSVMSDSSAEGDDSTAIGPSSSSQGTASVAMGRSATAMTDSAVAIGDGAMAMGGKAVSIGMANVASGDGAVAIGDPNLATGNGAVALGKDNAATGLGAIAIGNVNVSDGQGAAAIGDRNRVAGTGAAAIGSGNGVSGMGSIAIGLGNSVSGDRSIAIGSGVTNTATNSLALGDRATASGDSSAAIGNGSVASGLLSASYGVSSIATARYALALGPESRATAFASTALGTGAIASAFAATTLGTGAIAVHEGSVALGSASATVRGPVANYAAFGIAGPQASAGEIAVARNISYTNEQTGETTLTGDRQITGLAAGSADTDGVNVAQLRGAAAGIGTATAAALGGGAAYDPATGTIAGPRYVVAGRTYSNAGDAIAAIAASSAAAPATGGTPATGTADAANAVAFDDAGHGAVTLATGGTVVRNVADGHVAAGSKDAVNGGQLAAVGEQVAALRRDAATGGGGALRYASAGDPTKAAAGLSNDVALVGADAAAPVAVHNVAAGRVATGSTDAVNGGQLAAVDARATEAVGKADAAQAAVQTSVRYDGPDRGSVTLGDGAAPVAIHNVADGTAAHDVVNLGQVASVANAIIADDRAYTDARVSRLAFDLDKVRKDGNAGTAGALAMASMPQPYEAGRGMLSMAAGAYQGQSALAVGLARAMEDERTVVKLGATYDSRGRVGAGAGVGYQF